MIRRIEASLSEASATSLRNSCDVDAR